MDNLKEQILEYTEQVIVAYQSRIDNKIDSDALRKVLEEYPEKIVKAFKANNFVQLQAGEDGLLEYPEEYIDVKNETVDIFKALKAQKALDDKRIEQINSTDKIEIFIDGKKTVFVREDERGK